MVNRKSVFAWLFSLKYYCKRSQGVDHTYLILFNIRIHNYKYFFLKLSHQLLCNVLVGIIGICLVLSDFLNVQ